MSLIVHAPNVHQGGGRALLLPLLRALGDRPCIVIVDTRLPVPEELPSGVTLVTFPPTLRGRLGAERYLRSVAGENDDVLCFGNLPPLFSGLARVKVFLQNCYLLSSRTSGFPWRTAARIAIERLWLRLCLRNAELIVQTESMAREVAAELGRSARVMPFAAVPTPVPASPLPRYDFVYIASGEPHKNHRNLIQAWGLLAESGLFPSLCLTLHQEKDRALLQWIQETAVRHLLVVHNAGAVASDEVPTLYADSAALIYPSRFESFGLPLIEAARAGLPILASELDYVRDVATPVETFDAASPVSIARAVRRFLAAPQALQEPLSPSAFIAGLFDDR